MKQSRLREIINEELSKNDVKDIIKGELKDYTNKKDFEKLVKKISVSVIEDMYRILYNHSSVWKTLIK